MKKIALILMVAVLSAGSVFAAKDSDGVGLYARGSIGWASWTFSENGLSESVNHFSIEPVFGLTNLFPVKGLGIEGFVDCNFGGKSFGVADISSKVFAPASCMPALSVLTWETPALLTSLFLMRVQVSVCLSCTGATRQEVLHIIQLPAELKLRQ